MRNPCKLTSLDDWLAEGEPDIRPSQFVVQSFYEKPDGGYWSDEDWMGEYGKYSSPQEAFERKKMLEIDHPGAKFRVIRRVVYEWVIE